MAVQSIKSSFRRVAGFVACCFVALGFVVVSAAPSQAVGVSYDYYHNYFYSAETCKARGNTLIRENNPYFSYYCHRHAGQTKWSMDLFYEDGFGCFVAVNKSEANVRESNLVQPLGC